MTNCVAGELERSPVCYFCVYRLASLFTRKEVRRERELVKNLQETKIETCVRKSLRKFEMGGRIKTTSVSEWIGITEL